MDGARVGLVLAAVFAAGAIWSAYLPLWFADRGLSAAAIGTILGVASIVRVAAAAGWGWLADRAGQGRGPLVAGAALTGVLAAGLPAVPDGALLMVVAGMAAAAAGLVPLLEATLMALAGLRRLDYGRVRGLGSIAFMVASAAGGWAGSGSVPWIIGGCYLLAGAAALALPVMAPPAAGLGSSFRNRRLWLAVAATALVQGSHAAYYGFGALHWRAAGLSDGAIGLLFAEGVVAEVALFWCGRGLVERLGPGRLTAIAAAAAVVRWGAMALTTDLAALLLLQAMHAATFGCQHLSTMQVLRSLPAHAAGRANGLVAALGFSAPTGVLIWVSGQVYGAWGGGVFWLMAVVAAGGALLWVLTREGWRIDPSPRPGGRG